MYIIPFGEVKEDRFQISKKYSLIEMIAGIYRLSEKCKKHYDPISYIHYLRGDVEIPEKISKIKKEEKPLDPRSVVVEQLISL
jgi:hypothetical protein